MVQMQRQGHGGAIVNTSSWLAHGALPGSSLYSASKAALDGMARALALALALALESAKEGIRVNNVNPGIIETAMTRRFVDEATLLPFTNNTPMRSRESWFFYAPKPPRLSRARTSLSTAATPSPATVLG